MRFDLIQNNASTAPATVYEFEEYQFFIGSAACHCVITREGADPGFAPTHKSGDRPEVNTYGIAAGNNRHDNWLFSSQSVCLLLNPSALLHFYIDNARVCAKELDYAKMPSFGSGCVVIWHNNNNYSSCQ